MNVNELLKRAAPANAPQFTGTWGIMVFRPDLGSRQEFVIGAVVALNNDSTMRTKWLPSFSRISKLYGDALPTTEITGLVNGCTHAINKSFTKSLGEIDSGSPHIRVDACGFFSSDEIDTELARLLKRHSGALWAEPEAREDSMNDDWAYSQMLKAIEKLNVPQSIIVQNRSLTIGQRNLNIAFDNGSSYASVVSGRYTNYSTVERHIYKAHIDVTSAHRLHNRVQNPALFVILPPIDRPEEIALRQKCLALLTAIEDTGIVPYASESASRLAESVEKWAESR